MGENIGFLGSGDVYGARKLDDGTWSGLTYMNGCDKFELKAESEIKSQQSKGRSTYGQAVDAVTMPKEPAIAITFNRPNRKVLAAALLGDDAVIDVTAGTITDEEHKAPEIGEYIQLEHQNVSSVVVDSYTEDTDYEVDARNGFIKNLAITKGTTLTIDYSYGEKTGFKINGSTKPKVEMKFILDGKNMVDDSPCRVEVYLAQIAPSSGWDMLSDDYSAVELEGICQTPDDKETPFVVEILG